MARLPRFYSQHGEDYLLWRLFAERTNGYFVDVGAFDGVHLSNSLCFEQQGWTGILVEAHPDMAVRCSEARRGSLTVHAACVADPSVQEISFYTETLGLLSGLDPNREQDLAQRYANRGLVFDGLTETTVPAITLTAILEANPPPDTGIDFLSVDVEGTEVDVFRGMDFTRFQPRIILVEANTPGELALIRQLLEGELGYRYCRQLHVNHFFVRSQTDMENLGSINVDCVIEAQAHPLGEKYTIPRFRKRHTIRLPGNQ